MPLLCTSGGQNPVGQHDGSACNGGGAGIFIKRRRGAAAMCLTAAAVLQLTTATTTHSTRLEPQLGSSMLRAGGVKKESPAGDGNWVCEGTVRTVI